MSNLLLIDLPVEILHRIFDYLDVHALIEKIRCVCKRLYEVVDSYNHFELKLNSKTKSYLQVISRTVQFPNITSLILSRDNNSYGCNDFFFKIFILTNSLDFDH